MLNATFTSCWWWRTRALHEQRTPRCRGSPARLWRRHDSAARARAPLGGASEGEKEHLGAPLQRSIPAVDTDRVDLEPRVSVGLWSPRQLAPISKPAGQ